MNFNPRFDAIFQSLSQGINQPSVASVQADLSAHNDLFASLSASLNPQAQGNVQLVVGRRRLAGSGDTASKRHRARKRADRERCIAILDTETDPFDRDTKSVVFPFLAVLYSDQFEPIVMWEENHGKLIERILCEIRSLPEPYIVFAHNGGKFDYMFFIEELRGSVAFKGRGIMRATIEGDNGIQEIRDSLHIIPQPLAGWKKDKFDYNKNLKKNREKFKQAIIQYCINDCKYLLQLVRKFIQRNGLKISIGQASMSGIRKEYKFARLGELVDSKIRGVSCDARDKERYGKPNGKGYFYGGFVACLKGRGVFQGPLNYIDVNGMYMHVMAHMKHPIGASYTFRSGVPDDYTAFVRVRCRNNGALIAKTPEGETTHLIPHGEFYTTIWEFEAALELGLIDDIQILQCVDCDEFSDFRRWVMPLYEGRQECKNKLEEFHARGIFEKSNDPAYDDISLDNQAMKHEMASGYGKFAQNPRKYTDHYFTSCEGTPDDDTDWGVAPKFKSPEKNYAIWERKSYKWDVEKGMYIWDKPPLFYNIGTAASITGGARSILMRARHTVEFPIYCDTDSIICRGLGNLEIDAKKLGAWKLEKKFDEVVIAGKKEYACKVSGLPDGHKDRIIVKSKGVDGVTYADMIALAGGAEIVKRLKAPTMTRYGDYDYIDRKIRATVPIIAGVDYGNRI